MDRISELPDVIIQHIISFLNYKEAARTMVLSKPWLSAWSTRQFLDFDETYFANIKTDNPDNFFLTLIDNTLQNHSQQRISIQKFRLHIETIQDYKVAPYIKKWLSIVLQNNPLELDFSARSWKSNFVSAQIFGSKSLQVLALSNIPHGFSLVLTSTDIMCRNLKNLRLCGVLMDDSTFRNLISCCSLIEELILERFGNFEVHIANFPYLRVLGLFYSGDHDVKINVEESVKLRVLSLGICSIVDEQLHEILSKYPLLRSLNLYGCNNLTRVNFSGHSLEFLTIMDCDKLTRINFSCSSLKFFRIKDCVQLEEAIIDAPKLELVEYYNSFFPLQKLIHITSPRPIRNAYVWVHCADEIDASCFNDLREFLTVFLKSNVEIKSSRIMLNSEGFRSIPVLYGHEVEMLKVSYTHHVRMELLDGLLSICHPKTVVCDYWDITSDDESVRNFCKKLKSRKIPKCCNSGEIKCWRHYLKDVELNIWVDNEKKPLR